MTEKAKRPWTDKDGAWYLEEGERWSDSPHTGWYAEDLDNGFVTPSGYGTPDIICHKNASPSLSSDTLAKVAAGGVVNFAWIAAVKKEDLKWTKIDAHGFEDGKWAAIKMVGQNNSWPVTVPTNLAAGKYVFRHEIITLYSAGQANDAQNYPQCLSIEVTGSKPEKPESVLGNKLYSATDPGIFVNVYAHNTNY
ncbi:murein transglycosylase [Pyrenophora seminiperda CCB06]|uniref:Murein transglycosylase n=1 Tax=Pyrenophora seminiperda CCB06 TaxID=1302712 RepID=A0A3M7M1T2_9PLEO|nr:murein transglycosylase [Pyrenophora seminiperda CCB06]